MNAYLIYLGDSQTDRNNNEFYKAFDAIDHRVQVQGMQNAYLVWSDRTLQDWYGYFGGQTTATTPLIFPVDTTRLNNVQGLPNYFRGFLDHRSKAA
jgi:hypothetical protein